MSKHNLGGNISVPTITTGGSVTTSSAMTTPWTTGLAQEIPEPRIMADGKNLIVHDIGVSSINRYIRFKDVNISDINITKSMNDMNTVGISLGCVEMDMKTIEIPSHIPVEQHAMYISGVFNGSK